MTARSMAPPCSTGISAGIASATCGPKPRWPTPSIMTSRRPAAAPDEEWRFEGRMKAASGKTRVSDDATVFKAGGWATFISTPCRAISASTC